MPEANDLRTSAITPALRWPLVSVGCPGRKCCRKSMRDQRA
jgi:hypothetical protein